VRSFAAEAVARQVSLSPGERFSFFTCNFNEEFTGFHGISVVHQATFLNDAIGFLLQHFHAHGTTSIILIGHSMGGIVARTMVTLPNYLPGSINTIVTMATPHLAPPVSVEQDLTTHYEQINGFWRDQFTNRIIFFYAYFFLLLFSLTCSPHPRYHRYYERHGDCVHLCRES